MTPPEQIEATATEQADPDWFRPPSRREHAIGAALFVAFGLFFVALFIVQSGWWFRWAVLGFAVISTLVGLGHLRDYVAHTGTSARDITGDK